MLNVKKIRLAQNMSQKSLAALLKIKPNTLSKYESGKRNPSISMLIKMSETLGCDFNTLISKSKSNKN